MDNNYKVFSGAKGGGLAFALLMIIYVFITFIGSTIVGAIFGSESVAYIAVCSCFSTLSMAAVIIFYKHSLKESFRLLTGAKPFKWYFVLIAAIISVAMFFGLGFVNDTFVRFLRSLGANVATSSFPLGSVGNLIIFTVVLALLPAIIEELFFRGLLLRCLKGVRCVYVVIAVSLCFSTYHCSAAQFFYQLVYGAALTLLALASNSVFPCVIAHFINNFGIILLEYLNASINLYSPIFITLGLVALTATIILLSIIIKKKDRCEKSDKGASFYLFAALGIAICLIMTISALFITEGA